MLLNCYAGISFTVGGDGNLYEGRGWDYQPELFKERPEFDESSICIGVLGDANGNQHVEMA